MKKSAFVLALCLVSASAFAWDGDGRSGSWELDLGARTALRGCEAMDDDRARSTCFAKAVDELQAGEGLATEIRSMCSSVAFSDDKVRCFDAVMAHSQHPRFRAVSRSCGRIDSDFSRANCYGNALNGMRERDFRPNHRRVLRVIEQGCKGLAFAESSAPCFREGLKAFEQDDNMAGIIAMQCNAAGQANARSGVTCFEQATKVSEEEDFNWVRRACNSPFADEAFACYKESLAEMAAIHQTGHRRHGGDRHEAPPVIIVEERREPRVNRRRDPPRRRQGGVDIGVRVREPGVSAGIAIHLPPR